MEAPTRGKVKAMLMWGGMRASNRHYYLRSRGKAKAQVYNRAGEYE
jgi:hypothetical protein